MIKKNAFTMAEVLITISLLGIVAAITIPSAITNYQKRIKITKVQKARNEIDTIASYIQARYPRWRNIPAGSTTVNEFAGFLNRSSAVYYDVIDASNGQGCAAGTVLIAVREKEGAPILAAFCASQNGVVEDNSQCKLENYTKNKIADNGCSTVAE